MFIAIRICEKKFYAKFRILSKKPFLNFITSSSQR
jgi:hypothetical protein